MEPYQADVFAELIGVLETGIHDSNFYMGTYTSGQTKPSKTNLNEADCGTTCCSMGLMPLVCPEQFRWVKDLFACRLEAWSSGSWNRMNTYYVGLELFGITVNEYDYLFTCPTAIRRNLKQQIAYMKEFLSKKGYVAYWPMVDA